EARSKMKALSALAAFLLSLLFATPAPAQTVDNPLQPVPPSSIVQNSTPVGNDYILGPGDELNIKVMPQDKYSLQNVSIDQGGTFLYPTVGEIFASGKTMSQLKDELQSRLAKFCVNPDVTVTITAMHPEVVYVSGGVGQPKVVDVRAATNVAKAITLAGGVSDRDMLTHVAVLRGNKVLHANVYPVLVNGEDSPTNLTLQPGDLIVVPTNTARIMVVGAVSRPGVYPLESDSATNEGPARLSDGIGVAGGSLGQRTAKIGQIALLRRSADGKSIQRTYYDFGKFLSNGDLSQNPLLRDGDVIVVPEQHRSLDSILQYTPIYWFIKGAGLGL
ncbi:MAG TPA: polysaccharide biosynthesis/export family protein, partial [Capsulimonadaceae bacterium]|nr:polysaccharide biosynthesis/export family protein [Capsulimonadaceae bacterium]